MITFFDSDVKVLENLRNVIQLNAKYVWCFVHYNIKTEKGIKIVMANEFDGQLSERKEKEVLCILEKFCTENSLEFKYETGTKTKIIEEKAQAHKKCSKCVE